MYKQILILLLLLLPNLSDSEFSCHDCETAFDLIHPLSKTDTGFKWVEKQLYQVCLKENGFKECQGKKNCHRLCKGIIRVFAPEFKHIFEHSSSSHFCHYFGFCSSSQKEILSELFEKSNSRLINNQNNPKNDSKTKNDIKLILQITDLHLTKYYQNGTITNCGLPVCCYNDSIPVNTSILNNITTPLAGFYGDYNCDTPESLLNLMLNDIEERFLKKYSPEKLIILWTGDTNSHRLWNQTQEENLNYILKITDQISTQLQKYGHMIISNYGNHDTYPINQFNYPDKHQWLFQPVGLKWAQMMSPYLKPESKTSLLESGNFVITLPFLANLSIISFNTNYYDDGNYWNVMADNHYHQLFNLTGWLNQTLETLEPPVYLVGHIPLGSSNLIDLIQVYQEILTLHISKIKGALFGHYHTDQFEILHQSSNLSNPILVLWSAPALIPDDTNPSYRLYEVSNKTGEILNYYQYRLKLPIGQNTIKPIPKWYLAYDFKTAYNQKDLSPESTQNLITRLGKSKKLFAKFENNYFGGRDNHINQSKLICQMSYARQDLKKNCLK